jgi:hypothetical protein
MLNKLVPPFVKKKLGEQIYFAKTFHIRTIVIRNIYKKGIIYACVGEQANTISRCKEPT